MYLLLCVFASVAQSQEEAPPPPDSVAIAVTASHKGAARANQVPQYSLASIFAKWGFKVESRVATKWDKALEKQTVKVVVPKAGEAAPPSDVAAFTLEGTITFVPKEIQFYGKTMDLINFVAEVDVVVKDAKGKELKKIAWKDYYGRTKDAGEETVLGESEARVTRFLTVDLFELKAIASQVPKDKQEEFAKFLAKEKEQRDRLFDDSSKRESSGK